MKRPAKLPITMAAAKPTCSSSEPEIFGLPSVVGSRSSAGSCWLARPCITSLLVRRGALLDGTHNDADVGDTGLLHRIHDGGEGPERHTLVGFNVDDL